MRISEWRVTVFALGWLALAATDAAAQNPDSPTITSAPSITFERRASVEFTSASATASFECRVDAASYRACDSPFRSERLDPGAHEVRVRSIDAGERSGPAFAHFRVINTSASGPRATFDRTPRLTFGVGPRQVDKEASYRCALNSGAFRPCSSPLVTKRLAPGKHTMRVQGDHPEAGRDPSPAVLKFKIEDRRIAFGHSVQGRELQVVRVGDAGAAREVLVVGSVHGDETEGHEIVKDLKREYAGISNVQFWIVETMNPDGVARRTRKNARGVDLNRNFGYRWSGAEPPSSGYYAGPRPFSEPEARALRDLAKRIRPRLTIFYHQPWGAVLIPCSGSSPIQGEYAQVARMGTSCRGAGLPGTATSWLNHKLPGLAFVVELHGGELSSSAARRHARAIVSISRPDSRARAAGPQPPSAEITSGPEITFARKPGFTLESDDPAASFECALDKGTFKPCEARHRTPYLGLGPHSLRARAVSETGEAGPPTRAHHFRVVDTKIVSRRPKADDRNPAFNFILKGLGDSGATFECALDRDGFERCRAPITAERLHPGKLETGGHRFRVRGLNPKAGIDPSPAEDRWETHSFKRPDIKSDPIPYGNKRKRQMAAYSKRRYGESEWRLKNPKQIVIHYTVTSTYGPVYNTFASNAPSGGEYPGVCTQFVVDKDGTIYQLVDLDTRCRHAIGLNHRSIGIEIVQEGGGSPERSILNRTAQRVAAQKLAGWLGERYDIKIDDVIGHAMVNDSRYFEDRTGLRNDHGDWTKGFVKEFRRGIRNLRG